MIKILKSSEVSRDEIFSRVVPSVNVEDIVADIIANVRKNGDRALYEYSEKFDKVRPDPIYLTEEAKEAHARRLQAATRLRDAINALCQTEVVR